jgi:hypothetical protein
LKQSFMRFYRQSKARETVTKKQAFQFWCVGFAAEQDQEWWMNFPIMIESESYSDLYLKTVTTVTQ